MSASLLGILGGCIYVLACLDYNWGLSRDKKTVPNSTTWMIWTFVSIVNLATYVVATHDFWKDIIPILSVLFCSLTLFQIIVRGKFRWPDKIELAAIGISVIAIMCWIVTGSAAWANGLVIVAFGIGFIPTWKSVWNSPECERYRPWFTWSMSYAVALIVVFLRWRHQWIDSIYPLIGVTLHTSVPVLSTVRSKK